MGRSSDGGPCRSSGKGGPMGGVVDHAREGVVGPCGRSDRPFFVSPSPHPPLQRATSRGARARRRSVDEQTVDANELNWERIRIKVTDHC
ncbi:hypothetical protein E2562_015323 [Oryza meyeriana var. granulata]|uniref:Uncharacterized protein n=1 Tax=Oryza meyeriana var. granulata TaxID=110450 RepID=A0A6G1DJS0_9ORYZ|nr:hypothetical protein E2562_015323 [Oryza meyeriana var. granulata]